MLVRMIDDSKVERRELSRKLAPLTTLWPIVPMSDANQVSPDLGNSKAIGRRGWFKQAGVAAAGLTLGSTLSAGTQPEVVKSARVRGLHAPGAGQPVKPRRGIDCRFDEGPV
jgi:hypothetical protein